MDINGETGFCCVHLTQQYQLVSRSHCPSPITLWYKSRTRQKKQTHSAERGRDVRWMWVTARTFKPQGQCRSPWLWKLLVTPVVLWWFLQNPSQNPKCQLCEKACNFYLDLSESGSHSPDKNHNILWKKSTANECKMHLCIVHSSQMTGLMDT